MAALGFGGTAAGAAIGTAIGPIGTLIGAGLGFVLDIGSWLGASETEKKAEGLQAESDILSLQTSSLQTKARIDETNANISAYESFLSLFPNYADLQKNTFEAQSRQEFKGLLSNFSMTHAAAGERGHVGGSAGLFADEARFELADFAGNDLALGGGDGGRYEMARTELQGTLDSQLAQAQNQLSVLQSSLSMNEETLTALTAAQTSAEARLAKETAAAATWWNPFD